MIGIATNNLPNRNGGRFSLVELQRISKLLPGVPLTFDHSQSYEDKRGKISSATLTQAMPPKELSEEARLIVEREGYWEVQFTAEVDGIEPDEGDGVSISVLYKAEQCPNCDCEVKNWMHCPRPIEDIAAKGYIERVGVEDVLELSLVLIPACKGAKVVSTNSISSDSVNGGLEMQSKDVVYSDSASTPKTKVEPEDYKVDDSAPNDSAPEPDEVKGVLLSADEINLLNQRQIEKDMELEAHRQQIEKLQADLTIAQKDAAEQRLKASIGLAMPGVNLSGATSPDKLLNQGRLGEWFQIWDNAPVKDVSFDNHTMVRRQRYSGDSFRYWLANRDSLRPEVERLAHASGFLKGSFDTATAKSDIPSMLLEYLSNTLRITHQTRKIFWQFPTMVEDFTRGPGDTVRIPRWAFLPEPTATADFTLTPGTALSTSPQNLSALDRSFVLEEVGSGKSGVSGMAPVGIPEFWIARSIQDLELKTVTLLGQNYEASMDLWTRSKYQTATTILYNDNGAVTSTPGDVGTGDDGTLTQDFLHSCYARMSADAVLPLPDGKYIAALNTYSASQLRKSLGEQLRITSMSDVAEITNLLPVAAEQGMVTNYLGSYCNFHIFETNVYGVGTAGSEGVQNATLGTGTRLTRSSWLFGAAAVGHGVGMQPQIFRNTNDDYGRMSMWVWRAHMAVGTLDVDPNNDASEQKRVYQIRCTDIAQ